jgi:hypothetical protein
VDEEAGAREHTARDLNTCAASFSNESINVVTLAYAVENDSNSQRANLSR